MPLYARSGIPEVWLVDLEGERVEVYRRPGPEGYAVRESIGRGGELSIQELPGVTASVDEILP